MVGVHPGDTALTAIGPMVRTPVHLYGVDLAFTDEAWWRLHTGACTEYVQVLWVLPNPSGVCIIRAVVVPSPWSILPHAPSNLTGKLDPFNAMSRERFDSSVAPSWNYAESWHLVVDSSVYINGPLIWYVPDRD